MSNQTVRIDGIIWYISGTGRRHVQPLCPIHNLRLKNYGGAGDYSARRLTCVECEEVYLLPRIVIYEKEYILDKIDSKIFKQMKVLNIDDEAVPIAESKISSKGEKHFVTAILTESKVGQRLVVYAGEKGKNQKTQIFVEPDIKRLSFDHKDIHPSEVFLKLEATFNDGTKTSMEKPKSKK